MLPTHSGHRAVFHGASCASACRPMHTGGRPPAAGACGHPGGAGKTVQGGWGQQVTPPVCLRTSQQAGQLANLPAYFPNS